MGDGSCPAQPAPKEAAEGHGQRAGGGSQRGEDSSGVCAASAALGVSHLTHHRRQVGHRRRQQQLQQRLGAPEVARLAHPQSHEPRDAVLHHHPVTIVLAKTVGALEGPRRLELRFLRMQGDLSPGAALAGDTRGSKDRPGRLLWHRQNVSLSPATCPPLSSPIPIASCESLLPSGSEPLPPRCRSQNPPSSACPPHRRHLSRWVRSPPAHPSPGAPPCPRRRCPRSPAPPPAPCSPRSPPPERRPLAVTRVARHHLDRRDQLALGIHRHPRLVPREALP